MVNDVTKNILQVLNFSTRDFHGSIDINHISKVISLPKLNPAPMGPSYLVGLLNLAGNVVPIIDLAMRLKMNKPDHYTVETIILICAPERKKPFGVVVDKVSGMTEVKEDMLELKADGSYADNIVMGAIKYNDYISLLINVENLIDEAIVYEFQNHGNVG